MVKNPPANAGHVEDTGSVCPWVGKIPGKGNGSPLEYTCLENPVDRGTWKVTVPGVAKSWA